MSVRCTDPFAIYKIGFSLYPQSGNSFLECHYRFPRLSFEEISRYNKRGKIEK